MIGFLIGAMFGSTMGVIWMALCQAAGRADREMQELKK